MVTSNTQPATEEEVDEEREFLEAELISDDATERLFSELRGVNDAEVRVYSKDLDTQKLDYLFSTTGDAFTSITELYDQLRDEYGGGVFRIHVRKAGKLYRNEEIRVRAPKRRGLPDVTPVVLPATDTGGSDMVTALAAVLERSNEQNREFMRMMIDNLKTSQPAAADPAAMSRSVLEGLVAMKEIVGSPAPASSGMDIESFLRIAEFTREIGGNAGEANGWDALKSTITGLAPMLMQGMAAGPPPGAGMPAPVLPPPGAAPRRLSHDEDSAKPDPGTGAAPVDPAAAVDPRELQARFEAVFPLCISAAQRDLDPFVYANLVIDQLGLEAALNMICQPGQLEAMLAQAPALQQWRPWFDELVTAMLEERNQRVHAEGSQNTDDDAAHGHSAGAGGDSGDAASDGAASEASQG